MEWEGERREIFLHEVKEVVAMAKRFNLSTLHILDLKEDLGTNKAVCRYLKGMEKKGTPVQRYDNNFRVNETTSLSA